MELVEVETSPLLFSQVVSLENFWSMLIVWFEINIDYGLICFHKANLVL
jgi:hypothetical protein